MCVFCFVLFVVVFPYYAVTWKVLEHSIAIPKLSLKLKAAQLPKHTCSYAMSWKASLKYSPKLSEVCIFQCAPRKMLPTNDIFPQCHLSTNDAPVSAGLFPVIISRLPLL